MSERERDGGGEVPATAVDRRLAATVAGGLGEEESEWQAAHWPPRRLLFPSYQPTALSTLKSQLIVF